MSFLNAEEPSACDLVTDLGIKVLWQQSEGPAALVGDEVGSTDGVDVLNLLV